MKRCVLMLVFLMSLLAGAPASASSAGEACDGMTWPSFAEVAETAHSIYLVKVTRSVEGIARRARTIDVMRGGAPGRLDLRNLQPGSGGDCPAPVGPYAQVGDRLLVAYDGRAADRDGSVDTVAHVGRMRDRRNLSGLERLTFEEARAYDAPRTIRRVPESEATPVPAQWSPRPTLVPPVAAEGETLWSCGGDAPGFPRAVLDGPAGVETVEGAVFDGLRSALETMRTEFEFEPREDRPHQLPWLLAYEDEDLAIFLVKRARGDEHYSVMAVERDGDTWGFGGYADECRLRPLVTHGLGDSEWRVDPASPPTTESSVFPVEVMERECASGQPATGRIPEPIVEYGEDAITVTIPVRPVTGGADCPGNPWTPHVLELDEPIGDRIVLDGGPWPPQQRWPQP